MSPEPTPAPRFDRLQARLQDSIAEVQGSPHIDAQVRAALVLSLTELNATLAAVASTPAVGEKLVVAAETVAREAGRHRPDRSLLERGLAGLHEAAQAMKEHEPGILACVNRIALALSDIGI